MSAVICHAPRTTNWKQLVSFAGPGEALIKVEAVGICASDLKCYHGATKFWGDSRPAWAETEVILDMSSRAPLCNSTAKRPSDGGIAVGDRVVSEQIVPCWKCRYRLRGQYWMCSPRHVRLQASHPRCDGGLHDLFRRRLGARSRVTYRRTTPPSPSRLPARCTRLNVPASPSMTPSWSPAAARSVWAWWPAPARSRRRM